MSSRLAGRILFLAVSRNGTVLGYVASPKSLIANEFHSIASPKAHGIFTVIDLVQNLSGKQKLILQLKRIHELGWIKSRRLDSYGSYMACESSNCGGYTLEAELGIIPNGRSEPD